MRCPPRPDTRPHSSHLARTPVAQFRICCGWRDRQRWWTRRQSRRYEGNSQRRQGVLGEYRASGPSGSTGTESGRDSSGRRQRSANTPGRRSWRRAGCTARLSSVDPYGRAAGRHCRTRNRSTTGERRQPLPSPASTRPASHTAHLAEWHRDGRSSKRPPRCRASERARSAHDVGMSWRRHARSSWWLLGSICCQMGLNCLSGTLYGRHGRLLWTGR